jgi:hypothetical protein
MHAAARPFVTGGIALVGASVIAVSPIAPPLPDLHLPSPAQVTAATELAAFVNPIGNLVDVITASVNNVGTTVSQIFADPVPVLQQIVANQLGVANTLGTAAQGLVTAIGDSTLPAALQTALGQIGQGDITGAVQTFNTALTISLLNVITPLQPVLNIPSVIVQNLLNVTNTIPNVVLSIGLGVLSNVEGLTVQMGDSAQAFIDAVGAGDVGTAVSTVLNAPIDLAGAFLNGIPNGNVGILSPNLGLLNTFLVGIPKMIAAALALGAPAPTPPPMPAVKELKAASTVPSSSAKTVNLSVPAPVKARAGKGSSPLNAGKASAGSGAGSANSTAGAAGTKAGHGSAKQHAGQHAGNVGRHAGKGGNSK